MKIGVIGVGDICQKAYLPVLSIREGVDLLLCTRNRDTLMKVSERYRISSYTHSIQELVDRGIDAAFVHTATSSHAAIVRLLLSNGIPVYVDKPIAYHYEEAEELAELCARKNTIMMVGFNRRYAPLIQRLRQNGDPDIVLMQKNRLFLPGVPRTFIFDDFIHVVDTLRFLTGHNTTNFSVKGRYEDGQLFSVALELTGMDTVSIGIMNRDGGKSEEIIEFMTPGNKYIVRDLVHLSHQHDNREVAEKSDDWEPTLYKRGFYQTVDHFIGCVERNHQPASSIEDALITHRVCEEIVKELVSG